MNLKLSFSHNTVIRKLRLWIWNGFTQKHFNAPQNVFFSFFLKNYFIRYNTININNCSTCRHSTHPITITNPFHSINVWVLFNFHGRFCAMYEQDLDKIALLMTKHLHMSLHFCFTSTWCGTSTAARLIHFKQFRAQQPKKSLHCFYVENMCVSFWFSKITWMPLLHAKEQLLSSLFGYKIIWYAHIHAYPIQPSYWILYSYSHHISTCGDTIKSSSPYESGRKNRRPIQMKKNLNACSSITHIALQSSWKSYRVPLWYTQ